MEHWKLRDPIARVKALLARSGEADEQFFAVVEAEADELAVEVRRVTRGLPEPDPVRMFEHVYSQDHPLVEQERDWFARYRDSFEDSDP